MNSESLSQTLAKIVIKDVDIISRGWNAIELKLQKKQSNYLKTLIQVVSLCAQQEQYWPTQT